MAVKIRLRRMGAHKKPFYRIVVADSRSRRDGRFIEELGYYNPLTDPATVKIDALKARKWLAVGALPTDTVRALLNKAGISKPGKDEVLSADPMILAGDSQAYLPEEMDAAADELLSAEDAAPAESDASAESDAESDGDDAAHDYEAAIDEAVTDESIADETVSDEAKS